jgi:FADH2 O2-dependent halogenase
MPADFDVAIVGSGFTGSLLAMIARRLGRSVLLIERGRHPRFAIGESSTPLANLLLEELAQRYNLPGVGSLAKHGSWQKDHADLACGLKRGFSFYHHQIDQPWTDSSTHQRQLLVAASPNSAIADTHWYRPDFDQFLAQTAQNMGVEYMDRTALHDLHFSASDCELIGEREGRSFKWHARFLVDASGPNGFLHRTLPLLTAPFTNFPATESLYTHFTDVQRWEDLHPSTEQPPYPVDDAALHHLFPGGWIWALRFNNGLTSAGVAVAQPMAGTLRLRDGGDAWTRLLGKLPSVRNQFLEAKPAREFIHQPSLSFRTKHVVGERWALLPSAAGFTDPLLSTGFPLALLGVERLARILDEDWG